MGRERGARALQDLQEHPCSARKLAERAAYSTIIQKSVPLPLPESRLVCLVTDLTMAIAAERTSQVAINYKDQDPVSFARMNARVQALLQAYAAANCHDWRSFARWSDAGYLRHLLHECDDFELMLICWKPGQTSRVHNHADSHCWLAVLAGEVQETQYRPVVPKAEAEAEPHAPAPLSGASPPELSALLLSEAEGSSGCSSLSSSGESNASRVVFRRVNGTIGSGCADALAYPAAADGDMATANGANGWACTLHLYAPPIRRVKAYEAGGHVTECTPGFYSRHVLRP
eukprot:XP_001703378.1 cysteine dioxygenase [Chlamydomonas reinhardtii]